MKDMPNIQPISPERVAEIRQKYSAKPNTAPAESAHGELSETKELQFYLSKFTLLRHKYLDEIPDHILKLGDPNYEYYKCRGAWWTITSGNIQNARDAGLLKDGAMQEEVQKFLDYVKAVQNHRKERMQQGGEYRYTHEDIDGANAFLDKFIAYFSQRAVESGAEKAPPAIA